MSASDFLLERCEQKYESAFAREWKQRTANEPASARDARKRRRLLGHAPRATKGRRPARRYVVGEQAQKLR